MEGKNENPQRTKREAIHFLSWSETNWSRIRGDYIKKTLKNYTKPPISLVSIAIVCCATVQKQQGEKIKPVAVLITRMTQFQTSQTRTGPVT